MQFTRIILFTLLSGAWLGGCASPIEETGSEVRITLGNDAAQGVANLGLEVPITGRAFVIVSKNGEEEPRLGTGATGHPLWGVDVRD